MVELVVLAILAWIRIHKLTFGTGCIIRQADLDLLAAGSGVAFLKYTRYGL